jgi:hypothetical protein
MGIFALGFSLWCLKDGIFTYPQQMRNGFDEFKSDYKSMFTEPNAESITLEEFEREASVENERWLAWAKYVHERDIKTKPDIVTQFVMAGITALAGVYLLSIPIRSRGRWIELSDMIMRTSWGQEFGLDQIEQINKRKWRDKGIAKVYYRDATNRRRLFVLDDFKFMRKPTDEILFEIEQRIEVDRITGGPLEPLPGEHIQEAVDVGVAAEADDPSRRS